MSPSIKLHTIQFTLNGLEQGAYTLYDIHWVQQAIDWLYIGEHITESRYQHLCNRVNLIKRGVFNV